MKIPPTALGLLFFVAGCPAPVIELQKSAAVIPTPTVKRFVSAFPVTTPLALRSVRVAAESPTPAPTPRIRRRLVDTRFSESQSMAPTDLSRRTQRANSNSQLTPRQLVGNIGDSIRNATSLTELYRIQGGLSQAEKQMSRDIVRRWGRMNRGESKLLQAFYFLKNAARQQERVIEYPDALAIESTKQGVGFAIGLAVSAMPAVTDEERADDARNQQEMNRLQQIENRREQEMRAQNEQRRLRNWQNVRTNTGTNSGRISIGSRGDRVTEEARSR